MAYSMISNNDGTYSMPSSAQQKEQRESGEKTQCKGIKSDKKRCKMMTSASSGYCYYHD